VAALVEAEYGDVRVDGDFAVACHGATGGNPFLLRELLRQLSAEAVAPTAASVAVVRQLAPPTVARAVLLRLARLGDAASALARAVAVLGDGTALRRACALADLDEERGDALAAALGHAGILAGARPLAFAHPVLRAAVYADIDPGERARSHRRAAALLAGDGEAASAIAAHLLATEPSGESFVVSTLRAAAARAREKGAASVAVACLRRAHAEPPAIAVRGEVLLELASAELHAGEAAEAAEHFEQGMRATGDPRRRATRVSEQAAALLAIGRSQEAYAVRELAAAEVASLDAEAALRIEAGIIASASLDLTRLAWARDRLASHRHDVRPTTSAGWRLLVTRAFVEAFYGDEPPEPLADAASDALESGLLVDARTGLGGTPYFLAIEVLWLADRVDTARQALDRAVEEARRRGSALEFATTCGWRCRLSARQGDLVDAESDARSCAELALAQGWFALAPPMLGFVLDVLVARGALDDAQLLLERSGMAGRVPGNDLTFYPMFHARARLRAALGDLDGARADLAGVARRRARWNTDLTLVPAALAAPELAAPGREEARASAERMLRDARAWGTPRAIGMALRAAGLAETGGRGIELLDEAAAVLERSPARLEHALALTDLGASLRRANRRVDARGPLRRALDLAQQCGAVPLADRAHVELRAAGGRPRRPRTTGADALTASERRIAVMAADGLSNREIAQALFVTNKTVESHLGNAYRKLDIRSRTQLATALHDQAEQAQPVI
jgi:DNA-binding CsgD family transcriptional regulator